MTDITDFRQWDVWVAAVYFEKDPGRQERERVAGRSFKKRPMKPRPVMVLGTREGRVVALKFTSNLSRLESDGYILRDWRNCGLAVPSALDVLQVMEIPVSEFKGDHPIGRLSNHDAKVIEDMIVKRYGQIHPPTSYISMNRKPVSKGDGRRMMSASGKISVVRRFTSRGSLSKRR